MLSFQSADLNDAISADLPLTYRRPTADLPLTYPSPYRGSSLGSLPHGDDQPQGAGRVWFTLSNDDLRRLARERWGLASAFRAGVIAGELNVRIANPYRGKQGSLFREGLRRGRQRGAS